MPTADRRNDPFEFERLAPDEVELVVAYREFTLAERNALDKHIAELRAARLAEQAVKQLELEVAGRGPAESAATPAL